jgi:hypothetical protein
VSISLAKKSLYIYLVGVWVRAEEGKKLPLEL